MREACAMLQPVLDAAISGRSVPPELPSCSFFFGLHDGQFAAWHMGDHELMNAISALDSALRGSRG